MTQEQKFTGLTVGLVAVAIIAIIGVLYVSSKASNVDAKISAVVAYLETTQPTVGASGTRFPNGISTDSTSPVAGEVRTTDLTVTDDATISGGTLNVTTAANATSTITVGCVSAYATSSATQIKLIYGTVATTTGNGFVLWQYGTCP